MRSAASRRYAPVRSLSPVLGGPEGSAMATKPRARGSDDVMRCSFCNKSQFEIRRLVAGPRAIICDECARTCVEIVGPDASPGQAPGEYVVTNWPREVHCSICRTEVSDEEVVAVGNRGFLCAACMAELRRELSKRTKR